MAVASAYDDTVLCLLQRRSTDMWKLKYRYGPWMNRIHDKSEIILERTAFTLNRILVSTSFRSGVEYKWE
jgi:hypothetical protein